MSASVLLKGKLFREAERRRAKSSSEFVTATVVVCDDGERSFWSLIGFGEHVVTELCRLTAGDHLALQGSLKIETYQHGDETRINRKVIVDYVLPLRVPGAVSKRQTRKTTAVAKPADPLPSRARLDRHAGDGGDVFGDEMPF